MNLQKVMNVFRQFPANSLRRGNFFDACFAQSVHRAKLAQEQILPELAHAGAIIENTLRHTPFHQQLMIGVGEAMGFIADALEQPKRARIERKLQWHCPTRPINLLMLLGQADDRQIVQT